MPISAKRVHASAVVGAAYDVLKGNAVTQTIGGAKYNQISVGLKHALSKRTCAYVSAAWQTVCGDISEARDREQLPAHLMWPAVP
jgi:predicted porin